MKTSNKQSNEMFEPKSEIGIVGKTSAFQPQGPQFDSQLCQDLNICAIFLSTKGSSAFRPSGVGK